MADLRYWYLGVDYFDRNGRYRPKELDSMVKGHLNEDGTALLTIPGENATLTAVELDEVIAGLASLRSRMEPAVPSDVPAGPTLVVVDPRYWVEYSAEFAGSLMRFRDPGLGWRSYVLPHKEVANLYQILAMQLRVLAGAPIIGMAPPTKPESSDTTKL